MSRYITEPELAMTKVIIQCCDMQAYQNKQRYELLLARG
jgi:hypothetical protein